MKESIKVPLNKLYAAGLDPESMGWKAIVNEKDFAKEDFKAALTTTEVGGIRGFFKKIIDKFKDIGGK